MSKSSIKLDKLSQFPKFNDQIMLIQNKAGYCVLPKLYRNKLYVGKITYGSKGPKPHYIYKVNKDLFNKMLKQCPEGNISGKIRISKDEKSVSMVPMEGLTYSGPHNNASKFKYYKGKFIPSTNDRKGFHKDFSTTSASYIYQKGNFKYERNSKNKKITCKKSSNYCKKKKCKGKSYWCPTIKKPYSCDGEWRCDKGNNINCMDGDNIKSFYECV